MVKSILVPLDGTRAAETGIRWASSAALASSARVHLLTIVRENDAEGDQPESAEEYLRAQQSALNSSGVPADIEVTTGDPAECIIARADHYDLTVLTSGTVRWLISAVLDRILQDMTAPMVVVRARNNGAAPPKPDRILVPLDSVAYSAEVLPVVREVAAGLHASIVLLNVLPPIGSYHKSEDAPPGIARMINEMVEDAREMLARPAGRLRSEGLSVDVHTAIGDPTQEIVRATGATSAGLIAMATRGRKGFRFSGSVANSVLELTTTPCLLVRPLTAAQLEPQQSRITA